MTIGPRYVWVVTDHEENHRFVLAYVRALVAAIDPKRTNIDVRHVHVPLRHIRANGASNVVAAVHREKKRVQGARTEDAVLIFRDSEARNRDVLKRERESMGDLLTGIARAFPNSYGVVFNPMTESAFLLFDDAIPHLGATDAKVLRRLKRDRRQGDWVAPDPLRELLGLDRSRRKATLDATMAEVVFGKSLPDCVADPYVKLTTIVRAVVAAGIQ